MRNSVIDSDIPTYSENPSQLTWNKYLKTINSTDSFLTRYFHYLRIRTISGHLNRQTRNKKFRSCLDIGCNRGYYSVMAAEKGMVVDALDSNLNLSDLIAHPNVRYHNTDFQNFTATKKYDLILFFEVLEHIPLENREEVIKKIHSLLSEDGVLIFSGPNCFSFLYGSGYCKEKMVNLLKRRSDINWHYHIPFFLYKKNLQHSGFKIIQWHTNGVFPVVSDRLEWCLGGFADQVFFADQTISKLLKGFGANYYCIAQKRDPPSIAIR
jgi:SAM-dependent methyltransferase